MTSATFPVITIIGPDRIGIVEDLSRMVASRGGNIEESRMAVLGSEFAGIILVSMPGDGLANLQLEREKLERELNLRIDIRTTTKPDPSAPGQAYDLETVSFDNPGIVQAVTAVLKRHRINIEQMETGIQPAPMSGTPTFRMHLAFTLDAHVSAAQLESDLAELEGEHDLDISLRRA